jgi:hypothetical protein
MDEKGCALGLLQRARVLARTGTKGFTIQGQARNFSCHKQFTYQISDGNRENVTTIECICANGTSLRPLVIFKGQRIQQSWIDGDPLGADYAATPNGWTDNNIAVDWLEKTFDEQTKDNYPSCRLLILDGHNSHLSYRFLTYARNRNIIIICFPAHATAMLQPLDVVIFSVLSRAWSKVLETNLVGGLIMRKMDFCR